MKTKITAPAVVLAVAIAATAVAANLSGSARTIPMPTQGDPIPGVDVSIEQSPGGNIIATTQSKRDGTATFSIAPGRYVVKVSDQRKASNNYNSSKSNTGALAGATIVEGSLNFSKGKTGKATMNVTGTGSQTVVVSLKEGPDPKPTPTPRARN